MKGEGFPLNASYVIRKDVQGSNGKTAQKERPR